MLNQILWLEKTWKQMENGGSWGYNFALHSNDKKQNGIYLCSKFKTENCSRVNVVRIFGITYFWVMFTVTKMVHKVWNSEVRLLKLDK